jgi:hypothetical protein
MLKKNMSLLVAFILTISLVQAQSTQTYTIDWTQKLKVPTAQDLDILKMDANSLYFTSNDVMDEHEFSGYILFTKPHVSRYDRKSGVSIDREIILKNGDTRRAFEKVMMVGNTIHVFSSFINKDQKKYYIFDETLGQDSLEQKNDVKKIAELDFGISNNGNANSLFTKFIRIRDRILIQSRVNTKDGFFTTNDLFDGSMKKIASYNYQSIGRDFVNLDCTIDRNDNMYVLNSYINAKKEACYDLLYYSKDTTVVKKQSFTGLQMVGNTRMAVNKQNELIVAGLFAKANRVSAIGTFSIVFPAELSNSGKLNSTNFTDAFLTSGFDKKSAADLLKDIKKNKEFNDRCDYVIDTIHIEENGDFSFLTEKRKIEVKVTTSGSTYNGATGGFTSTGSSKTTYIYTYGDIYVCSYKADGGLKWCQNVAKNVELTDLNRFNGQYIPNFGKDGSINFIVTLYKESKSIILKLFGLDGMKVDKTYITSFDTNGNRQDKLLFTDAKLSKNIIPIYSRSNGDGSYMLVRMERFLIKINYSVGELLLK